LDSSRNAVKAVQLKARQLVSQNKRRYQVIIVSSEHLDINNCLLSLSLLQKLAIAPFLS
jgi:hypothetical protein